MKKALVAHPFLFAMFPVLFLFACNIEEFYPRMIVVPLITTVCLALVSWSVLSLLLRDKKKAGLVVSLFLLLFFSYENLYGATKDFFRVLGARRLWTGDYLRGCLLLTWAIVFALGTLFLLRTRRGLRNLTNTANIVAAALVVISLIRLGFMRSKQGMPGARTEVRKAWKRM